jgi:uncharacterized membrane protein YhiD involved in acid resistance
MTLVSLLALILSIAAVLTVVYLYSRLEKEINLNRQRIDEARTELEYEDEEEEQIDVEERIEKEAEELFEYLKEIHGFKEVTTYTELVSRIQEMEVEDKERKRELLDFYGKVIKLEYSDEEISSEEKEEIKDEAEELARTLERNQEGQEQSK